MHPADILPAQMNDVFGSLAVMLPGSVASFTESLCNILSGEVKQFKDCSAPDKIPADSFSGSMEPSCKSCSAEASSCGATVGGDETLPCVEEYCSSST